MASTFGGFNVALSGLRYQQVAMDVAANNIANVGTDGYVRRRVVGEAVGAPAVAARWSRSELDGGDGVGVAGLQRMVDALVVARARRENASQGFLDVRAAALTRVEAGVGEPGPDGLAAKIADFRASWHDLVNDPGGRAPRSQVIVMGSTVADAIHLQAQNVAAETSDQQVGLRTRVAELNGLLGDLAASNRAMAAASLVGDDTSILADGRDSLALRIAQLTGATATARTDGGFDLSLAGVDLVVGQQAGSVQATLGPPTAFSATSALGATSTVAVVSGEIGGVASLLDQTLPAQMAALDAVARDLMGAVNAQHALGFDATGAPGGAFFSATAGSEALTLRVALTSPDQVAASGVAGAPNFDTSNADAMADVISEEGWRGVVAGFGESVASATRLASNQQVLTDQVESSRDQQAGVNLDEEMAGMLAAQRAYEAASRVMTTLDDVLDTLINRTGVTR